MQNLKQCVQQQWLIADLEEISCPSLPPELPTAQKMTLNGNFALQVQGIRDISRPAYSQLKELTNSTNNNAEFSSAPKAAVPEWEAKPSRMLMLALTDGCIKIQGMEYKTINFLSPNFSPGIKVLIKGPIECRFGVLLLKPENISILGGAVESKLEQFSRENLLREQLQIERENDDNQQEPSEISSYGNPELSNHPVSSTRNSYTNHTSQNEINSRISSHNSNVPQSSRNHESNTAEVLDTFDNDDDFEQNIDYRVLDEIEHSQRQDTSFPEMDEPDCDIWQEDEDVVRDLMDFQDAEPEFKMPFEIEVNDTSPSTSRRNQNFNANEPFTYLSTTTNNPAANCVITIKGIIMEAAKLELEPATGFSLAVRITDGTAAVDVELHDKVLEEIMGLSASDMRKKYAEAAGNPKRKQEIFQILAKLKQSLQNNNNCLMDLKFAPGKKPSVIKLTPITKQHIQQLFDRVSSYF